MTPKRNVISKIEAKKDGFYKDEEKFFLFGINYHPSEYGLNYYKEYASGDDKVVDVLKRDFSSMKDFGLNSARIFIRLEDFLNPEYEEKSFDLLDTFVSEAEKNEIYLIPCFYGHMSGENTPKFKGSFYDDINTDKMLDMAEKIVSRYDDRNIILSWDPSNEPVHREVPKSSSQAYEWTKKNYERLKKVTKRPVILGDGATKRKMVKNDGAFHLEEICGLTGKESCSDGYKIHDYAAGRWTAFKMKEFDGLGKPLLLEEFGHSSFSLWKRGGKAEQANRIRSQSFSSILSDNSGVMPWCWQDFPFTRKPYSYILKEIGFGIHDIKGKVKDSGLEYKRFIDFVNEYKPHNYKTKSKAAILLPKGAYDSNFNPNFREDPQLLENQCYEIFTMASKSHVSCDIIREESDIENYEMLLLPNAKISESFEKRVKEYLDGGKSVLSFGPLGDITKLDFRKKKISSSKVFYNDDKLLSKIKRADFFESDVESEFTINSKPLLASERIGSGNLHTVLVPFDKYHSKRKSVRGDEYILVDRVAQDLDIKDEFSVKSPHIHVETLYNGSEKLILMVNHSNDHIDDTLKNPSGETLIDIDSEDEKQGDVKFRIGPRQVKVFYSNS